VKLIAKISEEATKSEMKTGASYREKDNYQFSKQTFHLLPENLRFNVGRKLPINRLHSPSGKRDSEDSSETTRTTLLWITRREANLMFLLTIDLKTFSGVYIYDC
jgi:hypothetical protein